MDPCKDIAVQKMTGFVDSECEDCDHALIVHNRHGVCAICEAKEEMMVEIARRIG